MSEFQYSVEPSLDNLDDALEPREQTLPSEDLWQEAIRRTATILGIVASPLLSAANVAQFAADVKAEADRLCAGLRQHLQQLGIDAHDAARLQTAQAALALVRGIAEASKDEVASVITSAQVATSAPAMGESLKKAEEMSAALENPSWELFETIGQLPRERAPQAQSITDQVKDALMRDEHVIELKRALKDAQSAALELLTSLVDTPAHASSDATPSRPTNAGDGGDERFWTRDR